MKILIVGGGSGGHITPAVTVAREILEQRPRAKIEFWTDRKYYANVVKITTEIGVSWGDENKFATEKKQYIRVRKVASGKFRRYRGLSLQDYFDNGWKALRDVTIGNVAGFFGFIAGCVQSFFRLLNKKNRPDVIFLKGGFVGLPVGLAAKSLRIPYIIHESDAVPGLANRLLMKHAKVVATGVPFNKPDMGDHSPEAEEIRKKQANFEWVGIPIAPEFKKISMTKQKELKRTAGFDENKPLVMVTGGSQGAANIDYAMREVLPEMLKFTSVGLVAGRKHYEEMIDLKKYENWDKAKLQSNFRMWNFSPVMNELLGAADVVVSRAGATTIAELAALSKAVILVPYEKLPGDHQTKNAKRLEKIGAVVVVPDLKMRNKPEILLEAVRTLIRSPKKREDMAEILHGEAKDDATKKLAEILIDIAER